MFDQYLPRPKGIKEAHPLDTRIITYEDDDPVNGKVSKIAFLGGVAALGANIDQFTSAELYILMHLMLGYTAVETALNHHYSRTWVDKRTESIYQKLGVSSLDNPKGALLLYASGSHVIEFEKFGPSQSYPSDHNQLQIVQKLSMGEDIGTLKDAGPYSLSTFISWMTDLRQKTRLQSVEQLVAGATFTGCLSADTLPVNQNQPLQPTLQLPSQLSPYTT